MLFRKKPGLNEKEMTSEYEKTLQNVLCLMIIADDNIEDKEVKTVSNIFNKLTNNKKLSKNFNWDKRVQKSGLIELLT